MKKSPVAVRSLADMGIVCCLEETISGELLCGNFRTGGNLYPLIHYLETARTGGDCKLSSLPFFISDRLYETYPRSEIDPSRQVSTQIMSNSSSKKQRILRKVLQRTLTFCHTNRQYIGKNTLSVPGIWTLNISDYAVITIRPYGLFYCRSSGKVNLT